MRRTLFILALVLLTSASVFAQAANEDTSSFVASTAWTASYADLAGVDDITVIAPASLRHPPEYELTPGDIAVIQNADYFVSAGYERMMSAIQEGIPSENRTDIHISTGNSIENVTAQADLIASYTGTQVRYDSYVQLVENARAQVEDRGLNELRVYCQNMLTPLAQDLGLNIADTFQGDLSASQIEAVANGSYDLVIDNYHSPSSAPLEDFGTPVIMWRNFPAETGRGALEAMVSDNISALLELDY